MKHIKLAILILGLLITSSISFSQIGVVQFHPETDQFVFIQRGKDVVLSKMAKDHAISFTLEGLEKYRINDSLDLGIHLIFIGDGGQKETSEVYLSYHGNQSSNRITIYKEMLEDDEMFKPGTLFIEVRGMDDKVLRKFEFDLTE